MPSSAVSLLRFRDVRGGVKPRKRGEAVERADEAARNAGCLKAACFIPLAFIESLLQPIRSDRPPQARRRVWLPGEGPLAENSRRLVTGDGRCDRSERRRASGSGPVSTSRPTIARTRKWGAWCEAVAPGPRSDAVDALIEEAIVDAHGDSEQIQAPSAGPRRSPGSPDRRLRHRRTRITN